MPGCCLRAQPWLYIDWQLFRRLGLDNTSISNGDDLITQLGVQEGSASPRRAQPPPPRAIELTAQRTAGDVDSKLTQSDIDIDLELEIEALDL